MGRKKTQIKTPPNLKQAGKTLWGWLNEIAESDDLEAVRPAAVELCQITDRLAEVRGQIAIDGVLVNARKNSLLDVEIKLSGQLAKLWRVLGLADGAEASRRPVGRPPESER
jgi:hypothetical protein